ncbi:hypothetical protein CHLRE_06g279250v5 [Chlamydomonas reinhardtii]|uniref:WIBG Mago-binding domain-containing protein n=1 Tax=Chlamydomonas reinhardtii TaxID=3055 RepID=A8J1Y0_CHLRE|nr:uncharacterized protein CHLRE_06g279250v5 [Chlamydomonas reinhardtii]PNW82445.1 hypothetical protein CHLRE_06g279250v5 [Chlamydomonas reinhardtii]|eukprot:XP_001695301.1 exon junction complex protein [Chlamydomonas reinhardtii]
MSKQLTQAVATETGEKVIAGSVRPDGTVRKERRIRAGYTPQDEQPVYQSRGTVAKASIPTCPGMDEAEVAALKAAASKGKKPASSGQPAAPKPKPAASAAPSKPATAAAAAAPATKPAVEAPPAAPEDPKVALEKQIRNLGKKVRQCAEIAEKKAGGAKLDPDQESKLAKSLEWQQEIKQLEEQLAKLSA